MRSFIIAALNIAIATAATFIFFELILRANPRLMIRGAALPEPIDPPLTTQVYDFHYSDGDMFNWRPDLVIPLSPEDDLVESHVEYTTDEFGFRNGPPLLEDVDIVVLGRSISQAAHLPHPWPEMLEKSIGANVLNLSQPGSGIDVKIDYLRRFGLIRHPKWVIVEIVPKIDILYDEEPRLLYSQRIFIPSIQQIITQLGKDFVGGAFQEEIYPIDIDIENRTIPLSCCLHYMEFYTLDQDSIYRSVNWSGYEKKLRGLVSLVRDNSACIAFLNVPTKPDIYFPLVNDPSQLKPTLREVSTITISYEGKLLEDKENNPDVETIINNSFAGRDVIKEYALSLHVPFIDPTDALIKAVLSGNDPFMRYDSHWNTLGHEIVASEVIETLKNAPCP